ncbi:hypothetical protein M3204_23490 [Mesobacillus subterraneus]|uniref:hypothetical protein n=1 Tax=Mesobacillus subterraneus TaxID=285983 RepID=UPI00203E1C50|nr:hypothetical protein [Mesobacillus subterraneus]MCM3667342.1 hypothetical protein [Mesobacillus subterraneus]MCM3686326.1 hypothetical protein [Mesobacillus subterraneus]
MSTTINPDYIVYFYSEEDETKGKKAPTAVYQIYVGPNDKQIGILSDSEKYAKLGDEDSRRLITILTFENV